MHKKKNQEEGLITDQGILEENHHYGSHVVIIGCGIIILALIALGILAYLGAGGVIA